MYAECNTKLAFAYLRGTVHVNASQWIAWAGEPSQPVADDDLDVAFGEQAEEVRGFSSALHTQLVPNTTDHPFRLVHNCP